MQSSTESKMRKQLKQEIFELGIAYSNMFQSGITMDRLESNISDKQRKFHYNVYKYNKEIFRQVQSGVFLMIDLLHDKNDKVKRELKSKIALLNILYSNKFESDLTFSRTDPNDKSVVEFHKKVYDSQEKVYNEEYEEIKKLVDKL